MCDRDFNAIFSCRIKKTSKHTEKRFQSISITLTLILKRCFLNCNENYQSTWKEGLEKYFMLNLDSGDNKTSRRTYSQY